MAALTEADCLRVLRQLGLHGTEVSLLLAGPRRVRGLNRRWRGIDRTTDVLSFPLHELGGSAARLKAAVRQSRAAGQPLMLGDIVIDVHQAERQARDRGVSVREEMQWLMVHGVLHLLGYDHEGVGVAEARRMRRRELGILSDLDGIK